MNQARTGPAGHWEVAIKKILYECGPVRLKFPDRFGKPVRPSREPIGNCHSSIGFAFNDFSF